MKNVYGHLQKIIEETLLTVSALDSITLQFPKKFSSVTAIKLIQTDGTFQQNMVTGLKSNLSHHEDISICLVFFFLDKYTPAHTFINSLKKN